MLHLESDLPLDLLDVFPEVPNPLIELHDLYKLEEDVEEMSGDAEKTG